MRIHGDVRLRRRSDLDGPVVSMMRDIIEEFGLTQQQLADHLGVARNTVVRHLRGISNHIDNPTMWTLALTSLRNRLREDSKHTGRRARA